MFSIRSTGVTQMVARMELAARHIEQMHGSLERASDLIYEETRQRFDSQGDGEWPPLTESTVAKKVSQGYAEPERELYAEGNLYESVTSPHGPYSQRLFVDSTGIQRVVMLVDFENSGWQIPSVLAAGSPQTGLPARPIWPDPDLVRGKVRDVLMEGVL